MLAKWRVYIKPFDDAGEYVADWVDVTADVQNGGIGEIATTLDNTDYNIGVYRNSFFDLKLRNDNGRYSDVGQPQSMFKYTRADSLVKITYDIAEVEALGFATCGSAMLGEEVTVFTGILNDESLAMDLKTQDVSFKCMGRESVFMKTIVPFGTISNGDLVSEVLYACLNQTQITDLLTVLPENISLGLDQEIDSIASLQNKTVQEALNKLLLASNSVLWIDGDAVKISPRTATETVQQTFYGQAAPDGQENIKDVNAIKSGLAKVFNFITWKDTALFSEDATSRLKYGTRKKEIDFEFFTVEAKQQAILDAIRDEFALPKQEFDMIVPLNYTTLERKLLDRISIDYPNAAIPGTSTVPIFGAAIAGEAIAPKVLWSFTVDPLDHYKNMGRSLDTKSQLIKLKVRAI